MDISVNDLSSNVNAILKNKGFGFTMRLLRDIYANYAYLKFAKSNESLDTYISEKLGHSLESGQFNVAQSYLQVSLVNDIGLKSPVIDKHCDGDVEEIKEFKEDPIIASVRQMIKDNKPISTRILRSKFKIGSRKVKQIYEMVGLGRKRADADL
jgi:hypothetical protein